MSTRDAIIRIKVQPGQFNSAIRQMQAKVSSAGKRMGSSLREPLRKGIEAGTDAARGLVNELGNALTTAATLGGAISGGALVREAAMAETKYIQLANSMEMFTGKTYKAVDAQAAVESVAKKTSLPIKDIQSSMDRLAAVAGKADIEKLLERSGNQARRLGIESETIAQVYTNMVAKGIAKTADEAEGLTEEIYRTMRGLVGIEKTEALEPKDISEMAAFINATGESAAKMLSIMSLGGDKVAKDFGKMNEIIEEVGINFGNAKGIKDMQKQLGKNKNVIDESKTGLENFVSVAEAGPKAFSKMAAVFGGDDAKKAVRALMGGPELIMKAQKKGKEGDEARAQWQLRVEKLKQQIAKASAYQIDRAKIEKEDAKHKETMIAKFDQAMNKLQMAMMKPGVIKAMNSLADSLPKLADELSKLIEFIANNPMTAIGAGVGLKVGGAALSGFGGQMIQQTMGKGGAGGAAGGAGGVGKVAMNPSSVMMNKVGGVAFAAAAGIAIGTAISETFVQPMAKEASKAGRSASNLVNQAENAVRGGTFEEKVKALDLLQKAQEKNKESLYSLDTVVGEVVGIFSDAKTPIDKYKSTTNEIWQAQERLKRQIQEEIEQRKQAEVEAQAKALKDLGIAAAGVTKAFNNMGGKDTSRGTGKLKTKPGSEPVNQSE